jgi:hypothetical protein
VEIAYDGRGGKPPPHFHPSQEERFDVLEGDPRNAKLQMALTMRHFRDVIRLTSPPAALVGLGLVARLRGMKPEYEPRQG